MTVTHAKVQLRRVARVTNGGTPSAERANWDGDVPWATPVDLGRKHGKAVATTGRNLTELGAQTGSAVVPMGSVLISSRAPIGYVSIAGANMAFNQGCKGITPLSADTDERFLSYALQHSIDELRARGRGSTFQEVGASEVASLSLPWPQPSQQRITADYLDHETAEIDALIKDLQLLGELTTERLNDGLEAIIVNLDAPYLEMRRMNPSRVSGTSVNGVQRPAGEHEVGVLKTGAASKGFFDPLENKAVLDPSEQKRLTGPVVGDRVLINRANTPQLVGTAVFVKDDHTNRYLSDKLWAIDFDASNEYMALAMRTRRYREQAMLGAVGASASMQNLSYEDFLRIRLPVPPRDAQERTVEHLQQEIEAVYRTREAIKDSISLAEERRAALITAAVTGQIDVASRRRGPSEAELLERNFSVATR